MRMLCYASAVASSHPDYLSTTLQEQSPLLSRASSNCGIMAALRTRPRLVSDVITTPGLSTAAVSFSLSLAWLAQGRCVHVTDVFA